jgi:hypothetical protein
MTIYVTEWSRTLKYAKGEGIHGSGIGRLTSIYAMVTNGPDEVGPYTDFKPAEWQELLKQDGVMYRYRKEPFRTITEC